MTGDNDWSSSKIADTDGLTAGERDRLDNTAAGLNLGCAVAQVLPLIQDRDAIPARISGQPGLQATFRGGTMSIVGLASPQPALARVVG